MPRLATAFVMVLGLCGWIAMPATAASFSCHKAKTTSEKAICAKPTLNVLDQRMGQVYRTLLILVGPSGAHDQFQGEQQWWLGVRDGCGADADCLRLAYHNRINDLNGYIAAVKAGG